MISMLLCLRKSADPKILKEHLFGNPTWKKALTDIYILDEASAKAALSAIKWSREYLPVHGKGRLKRVPQREILYLEKDKRCISIHMEDGSSYIFYGKFEDVMDSLSVAFCRCHNSYVVNLEKTLELHRYAFLLKNGERLPVSQKKYQSVKNSFHEFLSEGII